MAVRLNVVMNQTPPASPVAQRLGEEIVGELIGRPGIDMALVNASSLEDAQSTDLLTLESISGDFVYLDWKTPTGVLELLANCRIRGMRFPHAGDIAAPAPSPDVATPERRIYVFDLNQYSSAADVCSAVYQLLAMRQVRTFSLIGNSVTVSPRKPVFSETSAKPSKTERQLVSVPAVAEWPEVVLGAIQKQSLPPEGSSGKGSSSRGLSDDQLDALVDQLNADELG